jgi:hypothetical protein
VRRSSLALALTHLLAGAGLAAGAGCTDLRLADVPSEAGVESGDDAGSGDPDGGLDGAQAGGDAAADAPKGPLMYDDVQKALEAKRFPGPTTAQGSKGYCTPNRFFWRESDGTLHSWAGKTQARIDYGWKVTGTRPYFVPADGYVGVDVLPGYATIDVYRGDQASSLAGSIPYAFNFVSANDGIIRLDQSIGGSDIGGTKVRRWKVGTAATVNEDITAVLSTREPPSSFVNDTLVIPGGVTMPYPFYIVDVMKKTTGSVTFDGAVALQQTEEGAGDLVVAYVRSGTSGAALRIYRNNHDDAASRFELGDDLANRAGYFADAPKLEHKFLTRIATWEKRVLYGSAYGIWSYDLVSGALVPVQLNSGKQTSVPDVLCVMRDAGVLVYRMNGDTLGQVWAVPVSAVVQ